MSGPSAVVLDDLEPHSEALVKTTEDRDPPLLEEVAERHAGQENERGSRADDRVRDGHIVGRPRVEDMRFQCDFPATDRIPRNGRRNARTASF